MALMSAPDYKTNFRTITMRSMSTQRVKHARSDIKIPKKINPFNAATLSAVLGLILVLASANLLNAQT